MKRWTIRIGAAVAVAFLILTVVNAQWLAAEPKGSVKLVADRGIGPLAAGEGGTDCRGGWIENPYTDYLPNTVDSVVRSLKLGAGIALVDVSLSADGHIVLAHHSDLGCTSSSGGRPEQRTLEQLKALDIGYRFVADDFRTFRLEQTSTFSKSLQLAPSKPAIF